ncbi:MAG: ABC transporter substrate-binding protein [Verrucomicrobia bacterium]|jgi:ABC-type amino acid transport substrate-binding protein|nr:ABC transporter substrate-binding protein [Verrucomicrobiota bacterium]
MNQTRLSLSLLAAALVLLGGCATTSTSTSTASPAPADSKVLRVGIAPVLPPLAFKTGSDYKGVEPDLARALASDLGRTVQFVEMDWEKLMDALLRGEVDIVMSGLTITPSRLMRVNFSKPYLRAGQTLLVRGTDAALIQMTLFDPKTRIGAQTATTGDFWAKQNCARNERKLFRTAGLGAKALVSRQIDAFVCDAPVNWWLASENEAAGLTVASGYLTEEYLGWAVRKEDAPMLEAANRFIDQSKASGQLRSLIKNWIPYQ